MEQEEHWITVIIDELGEKSYDLQVIYYPAKIVRSQTRTEPEEWDEIEIEGVYKDEVELSPKEYSLFPYEGKQWLEATEINLFTKQF
jgi:hypothetical protein